MLGAVGVNHDRKPVAVGLWHELEAQEISHKRSVTVVGAHHDTNTAVRVQNGDA